MTIDTETEEALLDEAGMLGVDADSVHALADRVASGLPRQALKNTVRRVFSEPRYANSFMYRIVPEATYKRRQRLTAAESERTERLARVIAAAENVWANREHAREWLKRPHPELGDQAPIERSLSELGAREVEQLLNRLYFGIPG